MIQHILLAVFGMI